MTAIAVFSKLRSFSSGLGRFPGKKVPPSFPRRRESMPEVFGLTGTIFLRNHLVSNMRPYHFIPILECGEPLIPIPLEQFAVESPHPYERLGAPYGGKSPYFLREAVVERLLQAQTYLQTRLHPGWKIQIFDAYRPVAVQQFMVDHALATAARDRGWNAEQLTEAQQQTLMAIVSEIWAPPSLDLATPPPHSTGAAIDVTLVDEAGHPVEMGSPIDELSARSQPDYFATQPDPASQQFHQHRQQLCEIMDAVGFHRHPGEWWHFCFGDQMWAWLSRQSNPSNEVTARYGRVRVGT